MAAQSRNIAELENASVWRLLIQYSLPSIAGMVVYSLYNIIDSVFIGHGVGPLALSGLAVTFPIMNLTFALGTLVGIGGAAISSIRLGRKDQEGTERTLGNVLIMSLIAAVVLVIPTLLFLTEILTAFGASGQTLTYAYDFMLITLLGLPVTYVFFNLNHVMRATGYPKKAMGSTLLSVGINIILAPIFIYGFKWGIEGAALATVLSQAISLLRQIHILSNKNELIHLQRGIYRFNRSIVTNIIAIGMSPFLMNLAACFIVILINKGLKDYGGDYHIGAYGIVNRVGFFFVMIVMGLNQGMQPIAGYNFGAQLFDRVIRVLKLTIYSATCVTTAGFLIGELCPHLVASAFTTDEQMIDLAAKAMRIMVLFYPIIGFQMVTTNFFQSLGMAKKSIFLSLTRQLLFLLPCLLFLPPWLGVNGVWFSMPASDLLASIVTAWLLWIQLKKFKKMQAA